MIIEDSANLKLVLLLHDVTHKPAELTSLPRRAGAGREGSAARGKGGNLPDSEGPALSLDLPPASGDLKRSRVWHERADFVPRGLCPAAVDDASRDQRFNCMGGGACAYPGELTCSDVVTEAVSFAESFAIRSCTVRLHRWERAASGSVEKCGGPLPSRAALKGPSSGQ